MIGKLTLFATTLAMGAAALTPTAASAQRYGYGYGYDQPAYGYGYAEPGYRYRAPAYRGYAYARPHRCGDGTAGAVIGAIAGGLLGSGIAGRGDHTLGALIGAGGGALAGRAIERDGSRQAAFQGRCY